MNLSGLSTRLRALALVQKMDKILKEKYPEKTPEAIADEMLGVINGIIDCTPEEPLNVQLQKFELHLGKEQYALLAATPNFIPLKEEWLKRIREENSKKLSQVIVDYFHGDITAEEAELLPSLMGMIKESRN